MDESSARRVRHRLLGAGLLGYQEEHGEFGEEELAQARSRIFGPSGPSGKPATVG
ncbi:hypothetical protein ACWDA3_52680 [Nonomuraea rubra]